MSFLGGYAANIVTWAGIFASFSYFLGVVDEVTTFFRNNREIMIGVLIVHFAIYAIYYAMSAAARETRDLARSATSDE